MERAGRVAGRGSAAGTGGPNLGHGARFSRQVSAVFHKKGGEETLGDDLLDILEAWYGKCAQAVLDHSMAFAEQQVANLRQGFAEEFEQVEIPAELLGGQQRPQPQFARLSLSLEQKGNQLGQKVMRREDASIVFNLEQLQQNLLAIEQTFAARGQQEIERYFGQEIAETARQSFAEFRYALQQQQDAALRQRAEQRRAERRAEILGAVARIEEQLEALRPDFEALSAEVERL